MSGVRHVALAGIFAVIGSGCAKPIPPADVCQALLECAAITSPGDYGALIDAYGVDGSCWVNEADASLCQEACATLLTSYQEAYPQCVTES
ncbi:MAG: hypothetical protein GXP62_13925 [Oligoflexia bacterium]|nr:hypothetical protein [Oligoflexia bacterium]